MAGGGKGAGKSGKASPAALGDDQRTVFAGNRRRTFDQWAEKMRRKGIVYDKSSMPARIPKY
jgi:hypothetical protein